MRMTVVLLCLFSVLSASHASAERVELDLHDYDDELMRTLEQTSKYFEPDIGAENVQGATEDAEILLDGFKYTEKYFAKKGNYPDAVKWSQDGQVLINQAAKLVAEKNFDGAAEAAHEAVKVCKACHVVYKPAKAR